MKKRKFFIIMASLIISITILVAGCSAKDKDEKADEDVSVVTEEDEVLEEEENEPIDSEEDVVSEEENSTEGPRAENSYDIEVGELAPNFTLENLDGEQVSLEDYRGKIVMLNFWATWCKFCVTEMPDMNILQEENDDLVILAVNVKEEKDKVKDYIEGGGYDFEVVLDYEGKVAQTYLISAYPTSYFIDKEGILLGGVPGMLELPQMEQLLEGIRDNE